MNSFIKANSRGVQREATRARVLAVARAHFERDGFEVANVRAIAREARVAVGTVLLHFEDKRDLLNAALFDDLTAVIDEALASPPQPTLDTELRRLAQAFFGYYARHPKLSKTLLREALLAEPPWQGRFGAQVAKVNAHVLSAVERARAAREVAPEMDAAVLGAAFLAFYYFALLGWLQGFAADPNTLFARMIQQHLAVQTHERPKRRRS